MNSFMQLKIDGQDDSTYKKLRVIFGSGSYPHSMDQGKNTWRDWRGNLNMRHGPNFKYWYGKFRVKTNEDSGYATLDDLNKWHNSNTPADHKLVMRPHNWISSYTTLATVTTIFGISISGFYQPTYPLQVGQIVTWISGVGYATITSLQSVDSAFVTKSSAFSDINPGTNAVITGPGIGTFNCSFMTGTDPQGQVPMMESSGGFSLIDFRLESR